MEQQTYVTTGMVENSRLIHLDEPLPVSATKVSVIVKTDTPKSYNGKALFEWLDQLHERRKQLGVKSLTKEEVDAWIQEERNSWGD